MIHRTKHAGTNYRALKPFLDATDKAGGHTHFTAPGYMDLTIENLQFTDPDGNPVYSITHYGECNGDLMADPDMEIAIDDKAGRIIPRTYRNDYMGTYQEVFIYRNDRWMYSHRLLTELDYFLWQWLKNINNQGFAPEVHT